MAEIIHFKSRASLTAAQNVAEFVRLCREDLTALGADLPFDEHVWDISGHVNVKGRVKAVRVVFSNLAAAKAAKATPTMSANFLPFAKAYFRYWQGLKPTTAWANRLIALRLLDSVLCEEGLDGDVTAITGDLLTQATNVAIRQYSPALAPKLAGALEDISNFLLDNELAQMSTRWVKPIRKAPEQNLRVGAAADAAREKLMPSAAAIEAMAHVLRYVCPRLRDVAMRAAPRLFELSRTGLRQRRCHQNEEHSAYQGRDRGTLGSSGDCRENQCLWRVAVGGTPPPDASSLHTAPQHFGRPLGRTRCDCPARRPAASFAHSPGRRSP